ncbi:MAG TPA: DHHA1 domain-containing protein, partial [Microthrixaceae bacterium]|nr:DHHA1 domain-containing protein [Microthrixaceae bacterium]
AESGPTVFTGREENSTDATIVAVIGDSIFLDRSPFYAESGGQVGDTGTISTPTGVARVVNTNYAVPGVLQRHVAEVVEGTIEVSQSAVASIDVERRAAIRRNHTATHILHWALREVLGSHVKQQGSLVDPDRLRFDFSHFAGVSAEEIEAIEDLANHEVLGNGEVRHFETSMDEARELGAIAFFGDKYGERVRVLQAGDKSIELCGGTHVGALGDIGLIKITSEGSIGSNIRRIEAVTGMGPLKRMRAEEATAARAAELLGVTPDGLVEGVERRLGELKGLKDELKALRHELAGSQAGDLANQATDGVLVSRVEAESREALRDLAVALRDQPGMRAVVLATSPGGKGVAFVSAVAPGSGLNAGELISDAIRLVGGGGGKGADLAAAGGRDPEKIDEALEVVRQVLGAKS